MVDLDVVPLSAALPTDVVDAIVNDFAASLVLQPKTTRRYAEPLIVAPSDTPYLAVWAEESEFKLLSSGMTYYERTHTINVAWYVANAGGVETGGTGDPDAVKAIETDMETILEQLFTYANGIPGLSPPAQLTAAVKSMRLAPQEGSIWRGLVELHTEEAA